MNDGSKDSSLEILNHYVKKDKRIIVIDQLNSGVSVARNNALDRVKGEYYMFVDSDDWLDLDACEFSYNRIKELGADCLMFSYVKEFGNHSIESRIFDSGEFVYNEIETRRNFHRRLFGLLGDELEYPEKGDIIISPCMQLFRTSKFNKIRFYDIRNIGTFEDGLYQIDLYRNCQKFVYIDKPFYHYRKTNCNSITSKYNPNLSKQWMVLFELMFQKIKDYNLGLDYIQALDNRIAMSMIGLGLNEIHAKNGFLPSLKKVKTLLAISRVRESLRLLDTSKMPLSWKIFFFLCKHKLIFSLTLMLYLIEFVRTHRK